MRRIFIFLSLLISFNLTNQSCFASEAAPQSKNVFISTDSTPVYAGEKIVYVETGFYYPAEENCFPTFRNPEIYTPEFMQIFLKNAQLKDQCRTLFIEPGWQGLEPKGLNETIHYFDTVLKNGGVIFIVNFAYDQAIARPTHHMYNNLLAQFPGQIQLLEEMPSIAGNSIFTWWNNNPWKTSDVLYARMNVLYDIIGNLTNPEESIPAIIKKSFAIHYEQYFPAKLHDTISLEQFMQMKDPFMLVSLSKQGTFPLITFDIGQKNSHLSITPRLSSKPFDIHDLQQLETLKKEILTFKKLNQECEKKNQQLAEVKPQVPLSRFTEAFTYSGEKIVYLGIGTHRSAQKQFPMDESYPEFVKSVCQKSRYKQDCKLILIDRSWSYINKQEFATIFSQPLPQASFFVGDEFELKNLKQMEAYLETVLGHGGVVYVADFMCPFAPGHPEETQDADQIGVRNIYNKLLKRFPNQIEFFEYRYSRFLTGDGLTVAWWQGNPWDDRASNILLARLNALDSFFQKNSKQNKKTTLRTLKRDFVTVYNKDFPARLHATTKLEQFMHEKLPCVFISLAKTDLLPVLTFSIKKVDSGYRLEPQLSREPLDMFDLKQLDALYKDTLAREKEQKERDAKIVSTETSVQTTIEPYPTTIPSIESVQEEKKKAESSCVIA